MVISIPNDTSEKVLYNGNDLVHSLRSYQADRVDIYQHFSLSHASIYGTSSPCPQM
jgi:hypothetical protein